MPNHLEAAGYSERDLVKFMRRLTELVLAFVYFSHEAMNIWLGRVDHDVFAATE